MPVREIALPVGAKNLIPDMDTFNRSSKDGNIPIVRVFTGDNFVGDVLESHWKEYFNEANNEQFLLTSGSVEVYQGGNTNTENALKSEAQIPILQDGYIDIHLEVPTSTPAADVYAKFYLTDGYPSGLASAEAHSLEIYLVRTTTPTYEIAVYKTVEGTRSAIYAQTAVTNEEGTFRIKFRLSDVKVDVYFHDGAGAVAEATDELTLSSDDLDMLPFGSANPSLWIKSSTTTQYKIISDSIDVYYPDFSVGYDQDESDYGKGDVKCYDTMGSATEADWRRVHDESHDFTGDCVIENGLIRLIIDEAAINGVELYYWNGSAWAQPQDTIMTYQETDAKSLVYPYLKSIQSLIRYDDITIRVKVCSTASDVDPYNAIYDIKLSRGKYHVTHSIVEVNPQQEISFRVYDSTPLRFHYLGDGDDIGDEDFPTTITNTTMTDNFILSFDEVAPDVISFLATNQRPTSFHSTNADYISLEEITTADFINIEIHVGLVPFTDTAKLFAEAESGTTTGTDDVVDAGASGGYKVELDADEEYVYCSVTGMPSGRYKLVVRAKDSAQVTDDLDLYAYVYNVSGEGILNETGVEKTLTLTSAYAYYSVVFDIRPDVVSEEFRWYAKKTTSGTNTISIDYFAVIPIGDGESGVQCIAHNAMREATVNFRLTDSATFQLFSGLGLTGQLAGSVYTDAMAVNAVETAASITLSGAFTASTIKTGSDNEGIYVGAGDDLRIYHDGSDNYIESANGAIYLKAAGNDILLEGENQYNDFNLVYHDVQEFHIRDPDDADVGLFRFFTDHGAFGRYFIVGAFDDPVKQEHWGEFEVHHSGDVCIKAKPYTTGVSHTAFEAVVDASMTGLATYWKGFRFDGGNLDPQAANCFVYGVDLDFSDIGQTMNPTIYGFKIAMPTSFTSTLDVIGILLTGDGRTLEILNKDYSIEVTSGDVGIISGELIIGATTIHDSSNEIHFHPNTGNADGVIILHPVGANTASEFNFRNSVTANYGEFKIQITGTTVNLVSGLGGSGTAPDTLNINDADWDNINIGDGSSTITIGGASYPPSVGGIGPGTQWTIPVWITTTTIGDSMISQDSGGTALSVGGSLTVTSIVAESTDVDKFLVSNAGLVKFRTGAEVASDIGAASVPLALTDLASYAQGSIIIGGAVDWEALGLGTNTYVLKSGATDVAWGQVNYSELTGTQPAPVAHVLATTGPHTSSLPWSDLDKTSSSLADLATRTHASLSDAPTSAHHVKYANSEAVAAVVAENPLTLTNDLVVSGKKITLDPTILSDETAGGFYINPQGNVVHIFDGVSDQSFKIWNSAGDKTISLTSATAGQTILTSGNMTLDTSSGVFVVSSFSNFTVDSAGNLELDGTVDGVDLATFYSTYGSHDHSSADPTQVDYTDLTSIPSTFTPEAHVLAITGPHSGSLPLTDIDSYVQGSIMIGGGVDWEALAAGTEDYILKMGVDEPAWGQVDYSELSGSQPAPVAHVLATTGPHTGTLPLTDLALGTAGSLIVRGATDWEERGLGGLGYVLKAAAADAVWGQVDYSELQGTPPAPVAHVLATTGPHSGTLPWSDLDLTSSSLADLATRTHANLSDAPTDAHHSENHVLATTGSHSGTLPLTDLASYVRGSIMIGGAVDWEALGLGTNTYVLKSGSTDVAWGQVDYSELVGTQPAPVVHNLVDTTGHPVAGLTPGHVLTALTATTYGFATAGGGGVTAQTPYTANYLTKWDTGGVDITDSLISDNGTTATVAGDLDIDAPHLRLGDGSAEQIYFSMSNSDGYTYMGHAISADHFVDGSIDGDWVLSCRTPGGILLSADVASAEKHFYISETGIISFSNIAAATVDTDKFLVSDSGVVKFRTGTQVLSDIGAGRDYDADLMIGSANAAWVPLSYRGAFRDDEAASYAEVSSYGHIQNSGASDPSLWFDLVGLPHTRGGLTLKIIGSRVSIYDVDTSDYVSARNLYGKKGTTHSQVDYNGAALQTTGTHDDAFSAKDASAYDLMQFQLTITAQTAAEFDLAGVSLNCYYS